MNHANCVLLHSRSFHFVKDLYHREFTKDVVMFPSSGGPQLGVPTTPCG